MNDANEGLENLKRVAANNGVQMATLSDDAPIDAALPKKGLQKKWGVGEQLPWKGIWFEVAVVEEDTLILVPKGTTFKRYKQLEKVRQAALKE